MLTLPPNIVLLPWQIGLLLAKTIGAIGLLPTIVVKVRGALEPQALLAVTPKVPAVVVLSNKIETVLLVLVKLAPFPE